MSMSQYLNKEYLPVALIFENQKATPSKLVIHTVMGDSEKVKQLYASVYSGDDYTITEVVI